MKQALGTYIYYPNYIFILNLTRGFNGLGKDNCKTRREMSMYGIGRVLY